MSAVAGLQAQISAALKAGDKPRLNVLRLLLAAVKQGQIDGGKEADEAAVVAAAEKMIKQRRESIRQYTAGGRADLAQAEEAEVALLQPFLPAQLSEEELRAMVAQAAAEAGATSPKDMGKVMSALKEKTAGRADMGVVSQMVKAVLAGAN